MSAWNPVSAQVIAPARSKRTEKLVLLGASGSIGSSTLDILRRNPGQIELIAVSVHSSLPKLADILNAFPSIKYAAITGIQSPETLTDFSRQFGAVKFFSGAHAANELLNAGRAANADTVISAVVGAAGISPTLRAIELGYKIALANKETMVTAGPVIERALADSKDASMVPVDSEHNALFQLLLGLHPSHLKLAILTASGGPFLNRTAEEVKRVRREDVLNHPTWNMGPKITVDSAGLINKGLEIIEAMHLFSIPLEQLDVLIHPVSHVHALVETSDGFRFMANRPSMLFPIAHALYFPEPPPVYSDIVTRPDAWPSLEFRKVDEAQFPGFALCMRAARAGGTGPAIFNAANEIAAGLFLDGLIQFTDIPVLLEMVLSASSIEKGSELGLYLEADARARESTHALSKNLANRIKEVV
ncbi:MAG: 1-deoxy-D-xylulose-5-phosphate reductoisomerase [Spirochaetia bacterium]|nr:1-deoxy-D-xylulose-5-phosphate reductoisomerase [Spirochaetia bacterium]